MEDNNGLGISSNKDTIYFSSGDVVYKGMELNIGEGSLEDGDFSYIRINSASLFRYSSTTGYNGLANRANSFPRANSGLHFEVKRIEVRGSKKRGYVAYAVISDGSITKYEVDLYNAAKKGEIKLPNFKDGSQTTSEKNDNITTADKLKKWKDLLDSGAITQEEYDAQKKKLLGEQ